MELTVAVISVKLSKIIPEELETKIDQVNYWTDSMTVLKCIDNDTKRFHEFDSNRLIIIRSKSSPQSGDMLVEVKIRQMMFRKV